LLAKEICTSASLISDIGSHHLAGDDDPFADLLDVTLVGRALELLGNVLDRNADEPGENLELSTLVPKLFLKRLDILEGLRQAGRVVGCHRLPPDLFGRPAVAAQVVASFPYVVHIAGYVSQRRSNRSEIGVQVAIHGSSDTDVDCYEHKNGEADEQAIDADGGP
jgi:hypothetical protein